MSNSLFHRPPINIRFFAKDEKSGKMRARAERQWHLVPLVGDEVMLFDAGVKVAFVVVKRVWGCEGPDEERFRTQAVNVVVERATP